VSVTATTFYGNGANLTGIDATAIKFGGAVKVQANAVGAVVTGIATITGNAFVGGNLLPDGDNDADLGSSSKRWANLYTGDLNLSNEGSSNKVDGTSGSWTIQEGNSDLFLINNLSGKKYKFNLTEVN
jgi:expansin (peptidoglycan-binding protein)